MSEAAAEKDYGKPVDLGALSDEQIAEMSPEQVDEALKANFQQEAGSDGDGEPSGDASRRRDDDGAQSATGTADKETVSDVTDGAGSEYKSLETGSGVADEALADESDDRGNADPYDEASDLSGEDGQSSQADRRTDSEGEESEEVDYKAKYLETKGAYDSLMGEFKASGRVIKPESPDDARRLMQMGYDYTEKMRAMKPHLKILKTLEHNDLLDSEKINFMIDLQRGNEEAIKKFLRDNQIDPIDLDLEDDTAYRPNDHTVSDEQVALDEVLDSIRETEAFPRTASIITKEWDKASQQVLMGNPPLIAIINDHVSKGYYDQIATKVQYERSLGRLVGLSDLDAYKVIGDAMQRDGAFTPAQRGNTPKTETGQGLSQDSKGSDGQERAGVRDRKAAASPTKGGASAGKAPPANYLNDFSDEEIENMS